MVAALAVLLGALIVSVTGPAGLDTLERKTRDPGLVLGCWMIAIAGVAASTVLGVVLVLLPGHGASVVGLIARCWTSLQHGEVPRLDEFVGATAAMLLIVVAVRLLFVACRDSVRRRRRLRSQLDSLTLVGQPDSSGVVWVPAAYPAAFSVRARRGTIVATTGLRHLPASLRSAVLDHERAHLAGRHHVIIAAAEAVAASTPGIPLFRRAPSAVRRLAELAADRAASRRHGPQVVREALVLVAAAGSVPPAETLGMTARGTLAERLSALDGTAAARPSAALVRGAMRGATASAVAVLPLATAGGLLGVLTVVSCT